MIGPTALAPRLLRLLRNSKEVEASLGVRLLDDLRAVFGDNEQMSSKRLLESSAPWRKRRGATSRESPWTSVGSLGGWAVRREVQGRSGWRRPYTKGYGRAELHDAWSRYLPQSPTTSATSATSATAPFHANRQCCGCCGCCGLVGHRGEACDQCGKVGELICCSIDGREHWVHHGECQDGLSGALLHKPAPSVVSAGASSIWTDSLGVEIAMAPRKAIE